MRELAAERDAGAAELAVARAKASEDLALIAHQKLRIAKLKRQLYGPRSERSSRLIDQMALQFEELESQRHRRRIRRRDGGRQDHDCRGVHPQAPCAKPFPEHLPRERVIVAPPTA